MHHLLQKAIVSNIPESLHKDANKCLVRLDELLDTQQYQRFIACIEQMPALADQLVKALVGSEYIAEACYREPDILFHWLLSDVPFSTLSPVRIVDEVAIACSDPLSLDEFDSVIRRLRKRFMAGLYWRDINNLADFHEVSKAMTAMAEVFIQQSVDFHYRRLAQKHGFPVGKDSSELQPMLVLGMGKLGGGEFHGGSGSFFNWASTQ